MNARLSIAAIVVAASSILAACGGGGGGSAPSIPVQAPSSSQPVQSGGQVTYGAAIMQGAQYIGPARVGSMSVNLALALQNEAGLEQYAAQVSDPSSALYRHYLTPDQIGQRFGASTANMKTVAQYLYAHNLHVGSWPQRLTMYVSGQQSDMESAFGTRFGMFQKNGKTFLAPITAPSFATTLPVTAIENIVQAQALTRDFVPKLGDPEVAGYSPQQLQKVFDYSSAYAAGYTGAGITIAIIATGPMNPADVPAYGAMFGANVASVTQAPVTDAGVAAGLGITATPAALPTGLTTPPPVTRSCHTSLPACNPEDGEAQLDTEQIAGLAYGATVKMYVAYDPNGPNIGLALSDNEVQQIIADNTADVVSGSYGGGEQYLNGYYFGGGGTGFGPSEFAALASEGIASFFSTGDSGAEGCLRYGPPGGTAYTNQLCLGYPSSDPSVTAVGGISTPMDSAGNLVAALTGWGVATSGGIQFGIQGFGGSGGGCSAFFPLPSYQNTAASTLCGSMRANPDVSLEADLATGVTVVQNAGLGGSAGFGAYGGTSVAAPEMAAMWALVLQACKQTPSCATAPYSGHPYRLGNANPYLYAIYNNTPNTNFTPHLPSNQVFYDILYGYNAMAPSTPLPTPLPSLDPGYNAGPGFDLVTGIGVPYARHLIQAIVGV